jgi:hypothetical protein
MYNAARIFAALVQQAIKKPPATKLWLSTVTDGADGVKLIMTDLPSPVKCPSPSFHLTEYIVNAIALQGTHSLPFAVHPYELFRRWSLSCLVDEADGRCARSIMVVWAFSQW